MLFLKILRGESPSTAQPVVATTDPEVIAAVGEALARRLGIERPVGEADSVEGRSSRRLKLERRNDG
jgi:hypothetical protein